MGVKKVTDVQLWNTGDPVQDCRSNILRLVAGLRPQLPKQLAARAPHNLHCVSKNVPPFTCYNFDIHDPITIIFGKSVTEKVRNQKMLRFIHLTYLALPRKRGNPEESALVHCACNTVHCGSTVDFLSPKPCLATALS